MNILEFKYYKINNEISSHISMLPKKWKKKFTLDISALLFLIKKKKHCLSIFRLELRVANSQGRKKKKKKEEEVPEQFQK